MIDGFQSILINNDNDNNVLKVHVSAYLKIPNVLMVKQNAMGNVKHRFGNKNALRGHLKDDKKEAVCKALGRGESSKVQVESTGEWEHN